MSGFQREVKIDLEPGPKPSGDSVAAQFLSMKARAEAAEAQVSTLTAQVADYEEVNEGKKRLARLIDVAMHGEANAAPQASLCDLVSPALALRIRAEYAEAELATLRQGGEPAPFKTGQNVMVSHERYCGKGVVQYDTGMRKRMVGVLLGNGNTWEYEVETVTLDERILESAPTEGVPA